MEKKAVFQLVMLLLGLSYLMSSDASMILDSIPMIFFYFFSWIVDGFVALW